MKAARVKTDNASTIGDYLHYYKFYFNVAFLQTNDINQIRSFAQENFIGFQFFSFIWIQNQIYEIQYLISMGRKDKAIRREGRNQFRQFMSMNNRLHEMLRSLGEEEVTSTTIKLDQFEKLRVDFVKCSQKYQKTNIRLKSEGNHVERAKLVFELTSNKMSMESQLKQMTAIVLKLNERVKRQKAANQQNKNRAFKNPNTEELMDDEIEMKEQQMSPLAKELEYKSLIVYTFEKNYFKMINYESKEVGQIKRNLQNKKYETLQDFKRQNLPIDRLLEQEHEDTLQEKEILQALKKIDNMIEERMDNLLDGIRMMNYNAINISDTLDTIHKKILINLDRVEHNSSELKGNQKRLDEAAKYVSKPSCIMNIVIALLLGLIAFLVVKIIWFP